MILALAGALAIGVALGLLGSGGSILTVPILVYLLGHGEKAAIAESLAIVGTIAIAGAGAKSREVRWGRAAVFGVPGIGGAYAGAQIGALISGVAQLTILAVVMLVASVVMIVREDAKESARPARPLVLVVAGVVVGLLTGLVGVGGGFLIVPALVAFAGLSIHAAASTSLAVIALNCAAGFAKSIHVLPSGGVDFGVVAMFAGVGIVGALGGQAFGSRLSQRSLRRAFAGFLVALGLFILWNESPRLGLKEGTGGPGTGTAEQGAKP